MITFKDILDRRLNIEGVHILKKHYIVFSLVNGNIIFYPISKSKKLKEANIENLNKWRLISSGLGVRWEELDEDISLIGLLNKAKNFTVEKSTSTSSSQKMLEVE